MRQGVSAQRISSAANLGAAAQEVRSVASQLGPAFATLGNALARALDQAQEAVQVIENRLNGLGDPVAPGASRQTPFLVSSDRIRGGLQVQDILRSIRGQGLDLTFDAQTGRIAAYDHDTGAYLALTIGGTTITFTGTVTMTSPTLVTPTIASFTNAQHNHQNAAGGGALDAAAIAAGTLPVARGGTGVTASTGSGSVVLGTSPTIATPTITQTAWAAPTLLNSWVDLGSGFQVAEYMKDSMGFVHLRGLIYNGTFTDGTSIFVFPTGFTPSATEQHLAYAVGEECRLNIQVDGTVTIYEVAGNSYLTFGTVVFKAA